MKFVSKTSEKGLHIKPGELVLGSFPNGTGVNVHVENNAIVLLKSKMNAKELVSAAYALHEMAFKLLFHIWDVCGDCHDCSNRCPFLEIYEDDDEITLPDYLRIEAGIALEIARSMINPAAVDEFNRICSTLKQAQDSGRIHGISALQSIADRLGMSLDELNAASDELRRSICGEHSEILAALERVRRAVDALEYQVDDSRWPLPKYREMLFIY